MNFSSGKPFIEIGNKQHQKNESQIFYGINIASSLKDHKDIEKVFTDKNKCLALIKQFPESRFKGFSTYEEALSFSEFGSVGSTSAGTLHCEVSHITSNEKSSPFRGPKSQDLVKLRKSIEKGNIDYFNKCISENPRYLVSSGDTPTILQEGSRYNSLHIACKYDGAEFCQKVLSSISNPEFFQRLYPDDPLPSSERRSTFLLDLYLNTPDKGLNETPLHFACKFGSYDCVKLLTSYSICDKFRPNKYNETPKEVIFSRVNTKDEVLIAKIEEFFEEHCYVPVLRDDDNCLSPIIAQPWTLSNMSSTVPPTSPQSPDMNTLVGPKLKVRAYAGPMSPQKANSFYSRWKRSSVPSPQRSNKGKLAALRIKDLEKGVERVGRNLAEEFDVDWVEYWNFLGKFANLSSPEGLKRLEHHLKIQFSAVIEQHYKEVDDGAQSFSEVSQISECDSAQISNEGCKYLNESKSNSSLSSIGELCEDLEALRLNVSFSPNLESKADNRVKSCPSFKRKLSTSVSIPSSKKPVVTSSKEKQTHDLPLNCDTSQCDLNNSEYLEKYLKGPILEDEYYSFAIQSTKISAHRIACILIEVSRTISYHIGPDFQIARRLKNKIKPELQSLRKILCKCENILPDKKLDLGFIHIFLAATTVEQILENVSASNLYLISESLKLLLQNMSSINDSSSDECKDVENSSSELEYSEFNAHFVCAINKIDNAILLGIELVKEGKEEEKINLSKLDDCYCNWNDYYTKVDKASLMRFQPVDTKQINDTLYKQNEKKGRIKSRIFKAHSLLSRFLFGKNFEVEEDSKNVSAVVPVFDLNLKGHSNDNMEKEQNVTNEDDEWNDNESFISAVSSLESEDSLVTPEQEIRFFINGIQPTKDDMDVYSALEGSDVDESMFPYVFRWMKLIESYPQEAKEQWVSSTRKHRKSFVAPSASSQKSLEGGARKQLVL